MGSSADPAGENSGPLRALIVDEEETSREKMSHLLREFADIEIVGFCANGRDALESVARLSPHVVFLDVQLPEMDGFALVKALPSAPLPLVVFVTAHEKYAVRAFEAQAVDFLLKPIGPERLLTALHRVRARIELARGAGAESDLTLLRRHLSRSSRQPDRIPIKVEGSIRLVKVDEIDWIVTADNYSELHSGQTTHLLLSTLTALESRLPAGKFIRISRSAIVNIERIREVRLQRHGNGKVILDDGTKLAFSSGYRPKLDDLLLEDRPESSSQRPA